MLPPVAASGERAGRHLLEPQRGPGRGGAHHEGLSQGRRPGEVYGRRPRRAARPRPRAAQHQNGAARRRDLGINSAIPASTACTFNDPGETHLARPKNLADGESEAFLPGASDRTRMSRLRSRRTPTAMGSVTRPRTSARLTPQSRRSAIRPRPRSPRALRASSKSTSSSSSSPPTSRARPSSARSTRSRSSPVSRRRRSSDSTRAGTSSRWSPPTRPGTPIRRRPRTSSRSVGRWQAPHLGRPEGRHPARDTAWAMSQENVELFKEGIERFNRDDVAGALHYFHPEIRFEHRLVESAGESDRNRRGPGLVCGRQ